MPGCGYHWGDSGRERFLTIPFVKGDQDGSLTSELIETFIRETQSEIISENGRYCLDISIVEENHDIIGFRIDSQVNNSKQQKNIVADEGRKTVAVDVTLFDGDEVLLGPCRIAACNEYDYIDGDSFQDVTFLDASNQQQTAPTYSLGQLESPEAARSASTPTLYRKLAQKIVDLISSCW